MDFLLHQKTKLYIETSLLAIIATVLTTSIIAILTKGINNSYIHVIGTYNIAAPDIAVWLTLLYIHFRKNLIIIIPYIIFLNGFTETWAGIFYAFALPQQATLIPLLHQFGVFSLPQLGAGLFMLYRMGILEINLSKLNIIFYTIFMFIMGYLYMFFLMNQTLYFQYWASISAVMVIPNLLLAFNIYRIKLK